MAKLVAVVALCLLATVAAFSFEEMLNVKNTFDVEATTEAMTCYDYSCVGQGGDCLSTDTKIVDCNYASLYMNDTTVGNVETCSCQPASAWLAVGAMCDPTSQVVQCGPMATCAAYPGQSSTEYRCYNNKFIGDSCSAGGYDCMPPRTCVSGKCAANLALGATCYNGTSMMSLGKCPLSQYCPLSSGIVDAVCTNYAAPGASCASSRCVPYTICGLNYVTSGQLTCDRYGVGSVATGSAPTALGYLSCASYLVNSTSNLCVDYDTQLAMWKAAFPSPSTISCTTSSDCNLKGVSLAACTCTTKSSGNTPYCALKPAPSVSAAPAVAFFKNSGIVETAFTAGCEVNGQGSYTPPGPYAISDSTYCLSTWESAITSAYCPALEAAVGMSYSCYDQTYGLCNGASALKSSVFMTIAVAIVAFFSQ